MSKIAKELIFQYSYHDMLAFTCPPILICGIYAVASQQKAD